MLELRNVGFSYRKHSALRDVSVSFPESGIVCLVGPNGSGKSTLLKSINRIIPPTGDVLFDGRNVRDMSVTEIAKTFGYVPQEISNAFPITVFDMILLGRRAYLGWNPSNHDLDVVSENISRMGLDDFTLRKVNESSGGERQKVLIATALSQEPRVLLLDEPTSNLDVKHQLDVMRHLKKIVKDKKMLALMAMHDLNLASQYSDEVVMLNKGSLFIHGKPEQVLTKQNIQTIYRVNVVIHKHGNTQHIVPVDDDGLCVIKGA